MTALRVGLIVPSSNTVVEPELARVAGAVPDLELVATRVAVTHIDANSASRRQFEPELMIAAARLLAHAGVDVLVWAGTSGCWLGLDHDPAIVSAIEDATGIAATSSTLALLDACQELVDSGCGVVLAEHRLEMLAPSAAGLVFVEDGVVEGPAPMADLVCG